MALKMADQEWVSMWGSKKTPFW